MFNSKNLFLVIEITLDYMKKGMGPTGEGCSRSRYTPWDLETKKLFFISLF